MSLDYDPVPIVDNFGKQCSCPASSKCCCTKDSGVYEWAWDKEFETARLHLYNQNLEAQFHPGYSVGTAAVRGNKALGKGRHHFWEIKMITAVYGTDVMIGVGTKDADLTSTVDSFCSLLGRDGESWGYSYRGYIQHKGQFKDYTASFHQGSSVGVHLDTWKGTLEFFLDRRPLGIAFTGLRGIELYPMMSSTAAKSKMRITYSCSVGSSLQMECLSLLKPIQRAYLRTAFPGLKHLSQSIFADILQKHNDDDDKEEDYEFPSEYLILDDFDFALVGCKKVRKKRKIDPDLILNVEEEPPTNNYKAIMLHADRTNY